MGLALILVSQSSRLDHSQAPVTPPSGVKPAPPTPMAEQKAQLGDDETWDPSWDAMIEEALPDHLLSSNVAKDVKVFCPRFNSLSLPDKRGSAGAVVPIRVAGNPGHYQVTQNLLHKK